MPILCLLAIRPAVRFPPPRLPSSPPSPPPHLPMLSSPLLQRLLPPRPPSPLAPRPSPYPTACLQVPHSWTDTSMSRPLPPTRFSRPALLPPSPRGMMKRSSFVPLRPNIPRLTTLGSPLTHPRLTTTTHLTCDRLLVLSRRRIRLFPHPSLCALPLLRRLTPPLHLPHSPAPSPPPSWSRT